MINLRQFVRQLRPKKVCKIGPEKEIKKGSEEDPSWEGLCCKSL
jgi:hypothetical protein